MKRRIRVIVSGRVQGVYFRARTGELAEGLGLSGWVRNLPDGRVEIVGERDEEKLGQLLDWARVGPLAARETPVTAPGQSPAARSASLSARLAARYAFF